MYLGIDVGFSKTVRSTGICVIAPQSRIPVQCTHVRTADTFNGIDSLLERTRPHAVSINGPLLVIAGQTVASGFSVRKSYRNCEKLLSGGIFQKRCKPGPTNSPRGYALHKQSTVVANEMRRLFPKTLIQESFPNAFLGVLLPNSVYQHPIRRGIKSDVFWNHCLEQKILAKLVRFLFGSASPKIFFLAKTLTDHDERAAFICALSARGAEMQVNSIVGDHNGTIALPPKRFIQPWAWKTLVLRGAIQPASLLSELT